jgi:hydrogenase maturation protease
VNALIAGFGNIFRSDDGLGCAVLRTLSPADFPPGVRIRDFGTSGMQLALDMMGEYDLIVIVDAVWRDAPAGTVFAIACDEEELGSGAGPADAHAMTIDAVLTLYKRLREQSGGFEREPKVLVVGCVPQNLDDGMELSEPVRAAIPACAELVRRATEQYLAMGAKS